jgi:hypothetical protein
VTNETVRSIYCCGCSQDVQARLTDGTEIYPHRPDLGGIPFWTCDACGNNVGCHWKTGNPTKPLGNIATQEIKEIRKAIHRILDPLWQGKFGLPVKTRRRELYAKISAALGYDYHTGEIRNLQQAEQVLEIVKGLAA